MCISSSGRLTYVSPASALILGYEAYELLGTLIYSYIHPEDRYKLEHSDHGWDKVEYRARRKCGDYVWLETSRIAMTNEMEYFCISHDVSERKVFEEQIQEEKEKYLLLLENTVDTIGIVTDEGFLSILTKPANNYSVQQERRKLLAVPFSTIFLRNISRLLKHIFNILIRKIRWKFALEEWIKLLNA